MAYSFVAVGAGANGTAPLNPGAPAGVSVGDLLGLFTCCRGAADTITTPTGWTLVLDFSAEVVTSLALFLRIADGTANDTPTGIDWTGVSKAFAQIAAWTGGGYTDLGTIVAHSSKSAVNGATADLPNPALTITTPNCLVIGCGRKAKSVTSDGMVFTSPAGLNNRTGGFIDTGTGIGSVWDYTIQTSASSIGASIWDQSVEESLQYASGIVALQAVVAGGAIPLMGQIVM